MTRKFIYNKLKFLAILICLSAVGSFASCSSLAVGLQGGGMYSSPLPKAFITTSAELQPVLEGSFTGRIKTDTNLRALAENHYAVFGKTDGSKVLAQGHVIFSSFIQSRAWLFKPESQARKNEFYLKSVQLPGGFWKEHFMYENADDWFTELWKMNGYGVPEQWLVKRWSSSPANRTRIVVEYREPMPECVSVSTNAGQSYFVHAVMKDLDNQCRDKVNAFQQRADAAFNFDPNQEINPENAISPPGFLSKIPAHNMDLVRHVGEAKANDINGREFSIRNAP